MSDWGLYPSPPEPSHECNECGHLFDLPGLTLPRRRVSRDSDADMLVGHHESYQCPECDSRDIHRT